MRFVVVNNHLDRFTLCLSAPRLSHTNRTFVSAVPTASSSIYGRVVALQNVREESKRKGRARIITNYARIPAAAVPVGPPKATCKGDGRPAARGPAERSYEGHSCRSLRRVHQNRRISFKYGVYRHPRSTGLLNHPTISPHACTLPSHAPRALPTMIPSRPRARPRSRAPSHHPPPQCQL